MVVLALACAAIGLMPVWFWPAMARAASAWNPAWSFLGMPASLSPLGTFHLAFALVAVVAASLLWALMRQAGWRRALTWDCGYVTPTARMQYTAGSFAGIITEWFAWILRPQRHEHPPAVAFPVHAKLEERTPETVLEYVVEPAGAAVMRMAQAARRFQHGRVQAYLLYLVAGLVVLGAIAIMGGGP
jgi:hydrogenase-4 component B